MVAPFNVGDADPSDCFGWGRGYPAPSLGGLDSPVVGGVVVLGGVVLVVTLSGGSYFVAGTLFGVIS